MRNIKYCTIQYSITFFVFITLTTPLFAGATDPPNFIPRMTIQYKDPQTQKIIVHKIDSYADAHKTYQVPGGAELTLNFKAVNTGDNPAGDPVSADVWLDWTGKTLPSDKSDADIVCLPEDPGDCVTFEETITADAGFKGSGGKGVYNILIWIDRFDTQTEIDEEDNIMGPVKIVAVKTLYLKKPAEIKQKPPVLITPGKLKKAVP